MDTQGFDSFRVQSVYEGSSGFEGLFFVDVGVQGFYRLYPFDFVRTVFRACRVIGAHVVGFGRAVLVSGPVEGLGGFHGLAGSTMAGSWVNLPPRKK